MSRQVIVYRNKPYEGDINNDVRTLLPIELHHEFFRARHTYRPAHKLFKLKIEFLSELKVGGPSVNTHLDFQELIRNGWRRVDYQALDAVQQKPYKSLYNDGLIEWILHHPKQYENYKC